MGQKPSAAQKTLGDFAPKLAELTDSVLFGDVWERPGLSKLIFDSCRCFLTLRGG